MRGSSAFVAALCSVVLDGRASALRGLFYLGTLAYPSLYSVSSPPPHCSCCQEAERKLSKRRVRRIRNHETDLGFMYLQTKIVKEELQHQLAAKVSARAGARIFYVREWGVRAVLGGAVRSGW